MSSAPSPSRAPALSAPGAVADPGAGDRGASRSDPAARRPVAAPVRLAAALSRFHIVAIAVLGALTFGWLFTGARPWLVAAVVGLDWFLVNLCNRAADVEEDTANAIDGADFAARHRRAITILGLALLAGSLAGVHLVLPALLPLRLAFHGLGAIYNWRLLPGRRRLKELYLLKNSASAAGFLITCFGYPLAVAAAEHGGVIPFPTGMDVTAVIAIGAFFFLFELSYEVIYDLRDAPGDRRAGVATFPAVHGERVAVRIIDALIATAVAILAVGFAAGIVPWRAFVMVIGCGLQIAFYKTALRRGITSGDCVRITWIGAALLAAYHLWIAAGLPGVES